MGWWIPRSSAEATAREDSARSTQPPRAKLRELTLERARGKATDEVAPDGEGEQDHREHDHGGGGADLAPLPALVVHEIHDGHWRHERAAPRQHQRIEEVVPREDEAEDGGGGEPGARQGQRDAVEGLER